MRFCERNENSDLVKEAVSSAYGRALAAVPNLQALLVGIEGEINKSEEALDRYFLAFEAGKLSASDCGPRIDALTAKLDDLRRRRLQIEDQLGAQVPAAFDPQVLALAVSQLKRAIDGGAPSQVKALLSALVDDISVEGRDAIYPVFRVPMPGVRLVDRQLHQLSCLR